MCGLRMAASIRGVISAFGMRSFECTLATTTSSCASRSGSWSSAAVLEDVDLDAGQDAKRREPFVEVAHDVELLSQPLDAQPVRHREPWGVIREDDVLVADDR